MNIYQGIQQEILKNFSMNPIEGSIYRLQGKVEKELNDKPSREN